MNTQTRRHENDDRATRPLSYSITEAARISSLSRSTLYRHFKTGHLKLIRVGGRTLVDAWSLRALLGVANHASAAPHETSQPAT